ncbi:CIA30 family protein [Winogradskyella sp. PE311]|uniref:CIA30 family protein n=1 Tax=Winogradskyella sp. PE311 TaxID=3366943 RepID=UPI00397F2A61
MRFLAVLILLTFYQNMTLFNFSTDSDISNWQILDDVVMGGRSNGNFKLNTAGYGEFYGAISLKNNGGFSSLRYYFDAIESKTYSKFVIKLKGDGKSYQFRVKDKSSNRHSYIFKFNTTTDWQTVEIPFSKMYASFRGYELDIPNYDGKTMSEVAILIGNKKEESFKLLIDSITLE